MFVQSAIIILYTAYSVYASKLDNIAKFGAEISKINLDDAKHAFIEYLETYNKKYAMDEYNTRFEIFVKNIIDINKRNEEIGEVVYGVTPFLDLDEDEFNAAYTGFGSDIDSFLNETVYWDIEGLNAPTSWDWRNAGAVTPAKQQGNCNSCWSFSATGCLEGQYGIKHKVLKSLSEQQLVDCFKQGGGCQTGSYPHLAFNAIKQIDGIVGEADYPYKGVQGTCRFNKQKIVLKVKDSKVFKTSEDQLKEILHQKGPVSLGIYNYRMLQHHKGDAIIVPTANDCPANAKLNHAILLVGYGTEKGTPYWIIKNSWGEQWGSKGFAKLIRGKNACGIMNYLSIASIQ